MKLFDISPEISQATAVFPGDTAFSRRVALDFKKGDHLGLSSMTTTLHVGAHADAPSHYHAEGQTIDHRNLEIFYGPCQVVSVEVRSGERLTRLHLRQVQLKAPRVLIRTGTFPDPNAWTKNFAALSTDIVDWLWENGVRLVGVDTPSVDLAEDQTLEAHRAIFRHDMSILEGLVLDDIAPGLYTLSAFPLRIKDGDASPVRAVLIQD